MIRVPDADWPNMTDDLDASSLSRALEQSRLYLRRLPPDRMFRYGRDAYPAAHLLASLNMFEKLYVALGPGPELTGALAQNFVLYRSVGRDDGGEVLQTGYYEPLLSGSLDRTDRYRWPILRRPDDLVAVHLGDFAGDLEGRRIVGRLEGTRLVPYYSRAEIDFENALAGRNLELVWVDDPVALFFLHVQGSGRVRLQDGRIVRVGFAGSNGRPYRSLGRHMVRLGLLERDGISMQAIRDWLGAHPDKAAPVLGHNERYVFFRFLEGDPVGNINVPLTPGRSVALDDRIFPKGALSWISGRRPRMMVGPVTELDDFGRFVLVQDTGSAIRGPGRLDLFFGYGEQAEWAAGHMKAPGRVFFLVMKGSPAS